jgi:predicted permease
VTLVPQRYPQPASAVAFFRDLTTRVAALPDVVAAGATTSDPLDGLADQASTQPEGWAPPPGSPAGVLADIMRVTPDYFRAAGIGIIAGRDFTWRDADDSPHVTIVDERYARTVWGDRNPIGLRVSVDGTETRVVGVVRHARQYAIEHDDRVQVYRPLAQDITNSLSLAVRTTRDPQAVVSLVRRVVAELDPNQPLGDPVTIAEVVQSALAPRRLQLQMVAGFALGALLLAALGVYGMLSSLVGEQRREIGIRIALGARQSAVAARLMRRVLAIVVVGAAAGAGASLWLGRLIGHFLYGISALDPASYGLAAATLVLATGAATVLPVRRAMTVDISDALRGE